VRAQPCRAVLGAAPVSGPAAQQGGAAPSAVVLRQPRAVVVFGASAVLRRLILAPSRLPLGPRCGLANASPDRGLAGRPRMPLPARGVGRSSFHGALRGRSGRPPLCSRACGSLHSSTPTAPRSGRSSSDRPSAARRQRSLDARSRRTPRCAAPSSLTHAMPRALRSAQRDKRSGYSALPLPKPRRGHAHSLRRPSWRPVPKSSHQRR
jgi:hypothetical protein